MMTLDALKIILHKKKKEKCEPLAELERQLHTLNYQLHTLNCTMRDISIHLENISVNLVHTTNAMTAKR